MHSLTYDILHGMLTGFLISVPIGPVGVFTIQRSSEYGWRAGVVALLPVAILDSVVMILVLMGTPASFFRIFSLPHWVDIFIALFLLYYGIRMFRSAAKPHEPTPLPWGQNFLTSLAVAIANPAMYLGYAGIAILLSRYLVWPMGARIAIGIAFWFGTLVWWTGVIALAAAQRNHHKSKVIAQQIASVILMVTAVVILMPPHLFMHYLKLLAKSI